MNEDKVILVDAEDREIGTAPKGSSHDGAGVLHRAFSVFLFDAHGAVLLQQRAAEKRLWPLFWSNSCCSHPLPGEDIAAAAVRRVREELGVEAELSFLYKFAYQASFGAAGSENELCHVFAGRLAGKLNVNRAEIAAWRFESAGGVNVEMRRAPDKFTPWFKLEWQKISKEHGAWLNSVGDGASEGG